MQRKLFFWLERLKITPHERITVVLLMALLAILATLDLLLEPRMASDPARYRALSEEFERRSALVAEREAALMARYHPPPLTLSDTLPNPSRDDSTGDSTGARAGMQPAVNINTADMEQLQQLPGIGAVYAARILAYRKDHGRFGSVEELVHIKGIGEKRLEQLRPYITL